MFELDEDDRDDGSNFFCGLGNALVITVLGGMAAWLWWTGNDFGAAGFLIALALFVDRPFRSRCCDGSPARRRADHG